MACKYTYRGGTYTRDEITKLIKDGAYNKINTNKEQEWLVSKLGLVKEKDLSIVKGLVENRVFGKVLEDGKILLSDIAQEGTGYHEAFHRVVGMYLTEQEANSLFNEFRTREESKSLVEEKKQTYPDKSEDKIIEEILADEFRDYIMSNGQYKFPKVEKIKENFFTSLLKFLSNLLKIGKDTSLQEQLFKIIDSGKLASVKPINTYMQSADSRRIKYKVNVPGKGEHTFEIDEKTKQEVVNGMNYFFLQYLLDNNLTLHDLASKQLNPNSIYVKLQPKLLEAISSKRSKVIQGGASKEEIIALSHAFQLINTKEGFKQLVQAHAKYLNSFRIKLKIEDIDGNDPTGNDSSKTSDSTTKDFAFSKSAIEFDPFESVSANIKLILASLPKIDMNGNPILNNVGMVQTEDPAIMFVTISQNLSNLPTNPTIMLNKLLSIQNKYPSIGELIKRLNLNQPDLGTDIDSYNKRKLINEFVQAFAKARYKYTLNLIKPNGNIVTIDAEVDNSSNKIRTEWQSNFNQKYSTNSERTEFYNTISNLNSGSKDFYSKLADTLALNIGTKLLQEDSVQKDLLTIYGKIKAGQSNNYQSMIEDKSKKNEFQFSGNVDNIARLIAEGDTFLNLQHYNSEGKLVYGLSLNSTFTTTTTLLNFWSKNENLSALSSEGKEYSNTQDALKDNIPHILNVDTVNSIVLNNTLNGNPISILINDGVKIDGPSGEGEKSADLKGPMRLSQVLNDTLSGVYHFMQTGDREVMNSFQFANKMLMWDPRGSSEGKGDILKANKTYLNTFLGYLIDEVNTQNVIRNEASISEVNNIKNNKGLKFFEKPFEKNMNLITALNKYPQDDLNFYYSEYLQDENSIPKEVKQLFNSIKDVIDTHLIKEIGIHNIIYKNSGLLEQYDNNEVGISPEYIKAYGSAENAISVSLVNQILANIEQSKIFFGDLGFYKNADEAFKRFLMYNSTKKVSINDWRNNEFLQKTNSSEDYFIKMSDGSLLNYDAAKNSDYTKINETVMSDSNFVSKLTDQLEDIFKESLKQDFSNDAKISKKSKLLSNMYKKIEEGDGISWVNIYFYREVMFKAGDWLKEDEIVFKKIIKGEQVNDDELRRFTMLKPQYTGPLIYKENYDKLSADERVFVPAGRKTSFLPLIPQLVKNTNLEALHELMLKNGLDVVFLDSAGKYGSKLGQKFYNEDGSINLSYNDWNKSQLDWNYLGIQVDMNNAPKNKIIVSTQDRKNRLHNIFDQGKPRDFTGSLEEWKVIEANWSKMSDSEKEKASSLASLISEYNDLDTELTERSIRKLRNEAKIGRDKKTGEYKIHDWNKFKELLMNAAIDRNSSDNVLDAIESLIKDNKPGKINTYPNKSKLEQVLMSIVTNRIIRQKRSGDTKPQSPVKGFEPKGSKREVDKNGKGFYSSELLKFHELVDPKDPNSGLKPSEFGVPLPKSMFDLARKLGNGNIEKGIEELNKKISEDDNFMREERLFHGLRIPNQAYASSTAGIIKIFLHPSAYTIIVPSEFVTQTGSDFDIDKLLMYFKNLDSDGKQIEYKKGEENDDKAIENRLIDINQKLLLHPLNARQTLMPIDDSFLKTSGGLLGEILRLKGLDKPFNMKSESEENPSNTPTLKLNWTDVFLPRINYIKFKDFFAGVAGVGQFARHSAVHGIGQIKNVKINPLYKLYFEGSSNSIGKIKDNSGSWITETLASFLTTSVDAGKNPYGRMIGLTTRTNTLAAYLIRRGSSYKHALKFLSQPIIQKYIQLGETNESGFIKNTTRNGLEKSNKEIAEDAVAFFGISPKELKFDKDSKIDLGAFGDNTYVNHTEESLDNGLKVFRGVLDNSGLFFKEAPKLTQEQKDYQARILNEFLYYTDQSRKFEKFLTLSAPDTSSEKNIGEVESVIDEINTFIVEGFIENYKDYVGDSSPFAKILSPFDKARRMKTMFKELDIIYSKPQFKTAIKYIQKLTEKKKTTEQKNRTVETASNDFILYAISKGLKLNDIRSELVINERSTAKEINAIKNDSKHSLYNNGFIKAIVPVIQSDKHIVPTHPDKRYDTIQLYSRKLQTSEINYLTDELLKIKDVNLNLYNKIIKTNFIQAGINNSPFQLQSIIPTDDYYAMINDIVNDIPKNITDEDLNKFVTEYILNRPGEIFGNNEYDEVWSDYNYETKTSNITFKGGDQRVKPIGSPNLGYIYYTPNRDAQLKVIDTPDINTEDSKQDDKLVDFRKEIVETLPSIVKDSAQKHIPKEIFKIKQATQFIGTGKGNDSTTQRMENLYSKYKLANTGKYTKDDLIYVSSNGKRNNRVSPVIDNKLNDVYKNIDKAIEAKSRFIMDTAQHITNTKEYNLGEVALAEYLRNHNYERDDKTGIWSPKITEVEQNNFKPAFTGYISQNMFSKNDVMVFGANKGGFHGQGVAALAYANTTDNYKKWNPNLAQDVKENKVGDFAIAGKTELMQGNKGTGYGLVTVERPGVPLNYVELGNNIEKLYDTARKNPEKRFIVPYNDDNNLNKSSLTQLANAFGGRLIPTNVFFGDKMLKEIIRVKGEKVFEKATKENKKNPLTDPENCE